MLTQKKDTLSKTHRKTQKYANYELDLGYLKFHKQQPVQAAFPNQKLSDKVEKCRTNHKLETGIRQQHHEHQKPEGVNVEQKSHRVDHKLKRGSRQPRHNQQQKQKQASKPSSNRVAVNDHDISELTFRGIDPPERYQGSHPTKRYASGSQDPPAREGTSSTSRTLHGRLDSRQKSLVDRREGGGYKTRNGSSTPRKYQGAANPRSNNATRRASGLKPPTRSSSVASRNNQGALKSRKEHVRRASSGRKSSSSSSSSRSRTPSKSQASTATPAKKAKNSTKKKMSDTTQIKSILKKKDAPPPIAFFGGQPAAASSSSDSSSSSSAATNEESNKKGSRSSYESNKTSSNNNLTISCSDIDDETISIDMRSVESSSSMKSALRRGKYAAKVNTFSSTDDDASLLSIDINPSFTEVEEESFKFDRTRSHFLRTADLGLTQDTIFAQQFLDNPNTTPEPHYHHPTPHPPPGVQFNIDEHWICVDDGNGGQSPIAPQAVDALVAMGYRAVSDPMMWTPKSKTRSYMTEKRLTFDDIPIPGPVFEREGEPGDTNCLLWYGKFPARYHGSDIPVIRSQGFVNKSAEELVDLLMDSTRVEEYNKTSVGRDDEVVLSYGNDMDCPFSGQKKKKLTGVVIQGAEIVDGCAAFTKTGDEHSGYDENMTSSTTSSNKRLKASAFVGTTKLVRSTNKVPLIRKSLEFTTLLHCRELLEEQGGNGYIIVGRSVTPAEGTGGKNRRVIKSEVLFNVIIIRRLHQSQKGKSRSVPVGNSGRTASKKDLKNRCLVITMNHVKSPLIPKIMAKRVGVGAATNFLSDIRTA